MPAKKPKTAAERKTDEEIIAILKADGMTDEEIAQLGNDPDQWASLQKQQAEKVITIEIVIPPGQDVELTPEQFNQILDGAKSAIKQKMLTSTLLHITGTAIKTGLQFYLNSQTAGLAGPAASALANLAKRTADNEGGSE